MASTSTSALAPTISSEGSAAAAFVEPLLAPNHKRFVLFPIQNHKVRGLRAL